MRALRGRWVHRSRCENGGGGERADGGDERAAAGSLRREVQGGPADWAPLAKAVVRLLSGPALPRLCPSSAKPGRSDLSESRAIPWGGSPIQGAHRLRKGRAPAQRSRRGAVIHGTRGSTSTEIGGEAPHALIVMVAGPSSRCHLSRCHLSRPSAAGVTHCRKAICHRQGDHPSSAGPSRFTSSRGPSSLRLSSGPAACGGGGTANAVRACAPLRRGPPALRCAASGLRRRTAPAVGVGLR